MNKLMIIEPEPSVRLLYAEELMEEGFEVVTSDGTDLLDRIAQEAPDLLVWDLDLGHGKPFMKKIREQQEGLPVIFGLDHVPLRSDLPMVSNADYFIKGSDLEELKIKIRKFLNPHSMVSNETDKAYPFTGITASQLGLHF